MCTAITYRTGDHYFGRTLDLECSFHEMVTVTPRNFPFRFRNGETLSNHAAIIGMATVVDGYPLYYEGANEWGLAMAGLNFPGNAHYFPENPEKTNVAPFEFLPWILGRYRNLAEVRTCLSNLNLWEVNFSQQLPLSPLHWIIADRDGAITVESTADGLRIYDNPVGVLTNNPGFDYHMTHLCDYLNLTHLPPENRFSKIPLVPYSRGMGAMGLPGDLSSASRFVRAAFVKLNSRSGDGELESVSQFFHILGSVDQQRGCVLLENGHYEITVYTSCINTDKGIYYYTTYDNQGISAVDLHRCDLEADGLFSYPLMKEQVIHRQN